jgi:hypothetical protein
MGEKGLYFSASLLGNPLVTRATSQGNWREINIVSLGINVDVKY